jgi:PAS domain S-box-containing protein
MQLVRWCITGLRMAGAAALAGALWAGYLQLRPHATPAETVGVVAGLGGVIAGVTAGLAVWSLRRTHHRAVRALETQLAALRDNPSTPLVQQSFRPSLAWGDLRPLLGPLRSLAASYGQALRELVQVQEAHEKLRAFQERAGVEKGYSLSFIRRNADLSLPGRRLVARLAPNFHWKAATPALQQFLGRPMSELTARPFLDVVHSDDMAALNHAFQDALRDGEGHNITFRVLCRPPAPPNAPSEERHIQMDLLTRYTNEGAPLHLRCHLLDITDKVRTDQELRTRSKEVAEANERLRKTNSDLKLLKEGYRDLYNQAPAMYFSLDPRGRFVACNETMLHSLGYTREEVFGQAYTRVLAPAARPAYLRNPAAYRTATEIETQWVKKDGTVIDVWIRTTPLQDEQGQFIRSRSASQDMTERNRLLGALRAKQRELEQAIEQLRRTNRELDQFTYVVSHDLKEPLRTLEAFSTFLAQDYGEQLGPEGRGFINHLVSASRRLGSLISDLLQLGQAGRILNTPRPVDLRDAVRTVVSDLHDLIQRKEAVVRLDESLTRCPTVSGDAPRLMQLLANLVGNGLKYNTSDRPEVVVGFRPEASIEDGLVTLFVRDNGIGIDPQYHEQIFQLFRRLHHRDEYEGTGAGLAICQKIVEAHGGRIWVESSAGHGTTFVFTLPRPAALAGGAAAGGIAVAARPGGR